MAEKYAPLPPEVLLENKICCGRSCANCVYFPRHEEGNRKVDWNFLAFASLVKDATYELYQQTLHGEPGELPRLYLTFGLDDEGALVSSLEKVRPPLGGYWSEKKYGRPDYCPSATRVHKKRIAETGVSPNLVYFDSVEAAVLAGFTPCGNCYLKGAEGQTHWQEYLAAGELRSIGLGLNFSRPTRSPLMTTTWNFEKK